MVQLRFSGSISSRCAAWNSQRKGAVAHPVSPDSTAMYHADLRLAGRLPWLVQATGDHGLSSLNPGSPASNRRTAVQSSNSTTITSITCQTFTPGRTHPTTSESLRPHARWTCGRGLPASSGKIVPTPATSCASSSTRSTNSSGSARPASDPATNRLPASASPRTINPAARMACSRARRSRHS